jgi:hypothetical protein
MLGEAANTTLSQGLPVVAGQQLYSDEMVTTQCYPTTASLDVAGIVSPGRTPGNVPLVHAFRVNAVQGWAYRAMNLWDTGIGVLASGLQERGTSSR